MQKEKPEKLVQEVMLEITVLLEMLDQRDHLDDQEPQESSVNQVQLDH